MQKQRKYGLYVILLVLALLCTGGVFEPGGGYGAPSITAVETEHHIQAQALLLSYAWDDGEDQGAVYGKPAWEREYGAENTLVLTGEGQNRIALSAELPEGASYKIYLPGERCLTTEFGFHTIPAVRACTGRKTRAASAS